jgi:hypothetical protein
MGPLFEPWLTKKGFNIYKESHVNGSKRAQKVVKKWSFLTTFFSLFFKKNTCFVAVGREKVIFDFFGKKFQFGSE